MAFKVLRNISLVVITIIIASLALTQVPAVKFYFFNIITEKVAEETGYVIDAKDIDLTLPFEVKVSELTVAKDDKQVASVKLAIFRINPRALFQKQLIFQYITLNEVHVSSMPEAKGNDESPSAISIDLTTLPLYISLRQFHVKSLSFDDDVVPNLPYLSFDVDGRLLLDPNDGVAGLGVTIYDASEHTNNVEVAIDATQSDQKLTLNTTFAESGDFFKFLPQDMKSHLDLNLVGPLKSWNSFVNDTPDSNSDPIAGQVKLDFTFEEGSLSPIHEGHITGKVSVSAEDIIRIYDLDGSIDATKISGSLNFDRSGKIHDSDINIDIENIQSFQGLLEGHDIEGPLSATIQASSTGESLDFSLLLDSDRVTVDSITLISPSLSFKGRYENGKVWGEAKASLLDFDDMIELGAVIAWNGVDRIKLSQLSITSPVASIQGTLDFDYALNRASGRLMGEVQDLQFLEPIINKEIGGVVSLEAIFSYSDKDNQDIDIRVKTSNFHFETVTIDEVSVSAVVNDIYGKADGEISINGAGIDAAGVVLEGVAAESSISPIKDTWPLSIKLQGEDFNFRTEGSWHLDSETLTVTFDSGEGSLRGYDAALTQSTTATLKEDALDLTPIELAIGRGSFFASLDYDPSNINLVTRLKHIPIPLFLSEFYSQPIEGYITADAHLKGEPTNLLGNVELYLNDLVFKDETLLSSTPMNGVFSLDLLDDRITFSGNVFELAENPIAVAASLPIKVMLTAPMVIVEKEKPMSMTLNASGPLTPLLEFFPADNIIISGEGEIQIDIAGTLLNPTVSGTASLTEGSFESYEFGTILKDIEASFRGEDSKIIISALSAHDNSGGTLEGGGEIDLRMSEGYPFDLTVNLSNLQVIRLDNSQARFDGTISLSGNHQKVSIKGTLESREIRYAVTKKIDEIAKTVDVVYINQDPSVQAPTKLAPPPFTDLPLSLDITLAIPKNLYIYNEDFQSQWEGSIAITGDASKIQTHGNLSIANGIFMLNGQQYEIRQGSVSLAGNPDKSTNLYVVASRQIDEYRVDIILQGPVGNPKVILRSSPPLPQQGVLSLILFGKAPTDITAYEDQQLEQSLSSLTSGDSEPGVIDKIQKSIGVDRIDFKRPMNDDSDDMSIQVGKYITKNIFISLNKGFGEEANKVALEAKLRNNLNLKIEAGDRSDSDSDQAAGQISLIWKHDY